LSFERARPLRHATYRDVPEARSLLRQGLSLREAANELDIISGDLDRILWRWIERPDDWLPPRRPEAMF
jgi:hypothetical protein